MDRISPAEAKALLEQGWTYLDVRSEEEFDKGHPAGALNVPVMLPGGGMQFHPDFLSVVNAHFPKDAKLVVGCLSGGRSMRAVGLLSDDGFTQLKDQRAGFGGSKGADGRPEAGWAEAGLPVEAGQPSGRAFRDLKAGKR